jgi:hypothetical protein
LAEIRYCLKEILQMEGYSVLEAENKEMAESIFKRELCDLLIVEGSEMRREGGPILSLIPVITFDKPICLNPLLDAIDRHFTSDEAFRRKSKTAQHQGPQEEQPTLPQLPGAVSQVE